MKNLASYIKLHRRSLILLLVWMTVYLVVFFLSNLPLGPVLYGGILFVFFGSIFIVVDYGRFWRKHSRLQKMQMNVAVSMGELPEPEDKLEEDYQRLLEILFTYKNEMESNYDHKFSEMMDYYTMWAHQIKTPIAAMRLLLQTGDYEDGGELLEQLFKVEEYVGMVLQYLRMDNMGGDLKIRQYPLDGIVRQAIRKYSKSFIRKKICLEYKELECTVITDEKWLVFVVEQLLSNAIKYTRTGKISIYTEEKRPRTLVIADTGIGIEAEDLPRIFEKGFTGYNGRADKKSTGLGLYLCKTIMTKLNHGITIESSPGKGTIVKLDLQSAKLEVD